MKIKTKNLTIFILVIVFNSVIVFESISQYNYGNISIGIGSAHTPNKNGLRTYDLTFSNRIKISQGINIFGEYQFYIDKRNSVDAGFEVSFDKMIASVYEIENVDNSQEIEFENNPDLLRGNLYIGYGYDVFVFDKSSIKVKLDVGYPIFFNQKDSVNNFTFLGTDEFPLPSHGRIEKREHRFNFIISPKILYSIYDGNRKNSISIYLGYTRMTHRAFHGYSNAEFSGAGAKFTTKPFFYKAIDFGITFNFMVKNEMEN